MIDIVIPVYNARDDVARCVASVRKHSGADCRIILIDDASTNLDIAVLFGEFERLGDRRIQLIVNPDNLGFVGTVNHAFTLGRNDVVLLNSDTIVTARWLEKIQRCADSDRWIGTITPFSNNAEICSFPLFCQDNALDGMDIERINRAMEENATPNYLDIPTAVGFCMYIRRQLLDAIGPFDADTFGRGYGEENDFCMRAVNVGFRNVLCHDTFVAHLGGRSFSADTQALKARNSRLLFAKHPEYLGLVQRFIAADPIAPIRERAQTQLNKSVQRPAWVSAIFRFFSGRDSVA